MKSDFRESYLNRRTLAESKRSETITERRLSIAERADRTTIADRHKDARTPEKIAFAQQMQAEFEAGMNFGKRGKGKPRPSLERLAVDFSYDPDTGCIYARPDDCTGPDTGPMPPGYKNLVRDFRGRPWLTIRGIGISPSRLAFVLMGSKPPSMIRYRDKDPFNLRWSNIGPPTVALPKPRKLPKGIHFISKDPKRKPHYRCTLYISGYKQALGLARFATLEEAIIEQKRCAARWNAMKHQYVIDPKNPMQKREIAARIQSQEPIS